MMMMMMMMVHWLFRRLFNDCLEKLFYKDVDKLASFQPVTCFFLETHAQNMNQQTDLGNGLGRRNKEMKAIQTKAFTTGKVDALGAHSSNCSDAFWMSC